MGVNQDTYVCFFSTLRTIDFLAAKKYFFPKNVRMHTSSSLVPTEVRIELTYVGLYKNDFFKKVSYVYPHLKATYELTNTNEFVYDSMDVNLRTYRLIGANTFLYAFISIRTYVRYHQLIV